MRLKAVGRFGSAVYLIDDIIRIKHGGSKTNIRIDDITAINFKPLGLLGGYIEFMYPGYSSYRREGRVDFSTFHALGFTVLKNEVEKLMNGEIDEPKIYTKSKLDIKMEEHHKLMQEKIKKMKAENIIKHAAKKAAKNNVEDHL